MQDQNPNQNQTAGSATPIIIGILVLAIIGVGIFLVMRRNSTNSSNTTTPSPAPTATTTTPSPSPTTSPAASTTSNSVTISGFAFMPPDMTIKKGTTVTWTNQDSVAHTVKETDSLSGPNSPSLAQGKSYSFTFATAGTYHYDCSIHPNMTAMITVTD